MPKTSPNNHSTLSRTDIELLVGMKNGLDTLVAQVEAFRSEYKEQTKEIRQQQSEQFAVVIKRISDIETWKATEVQPTRIMKWDEAVKKVDDYLDDKHISRRERVFKAVESHLDDDGKLEALTWLVKTRDRLGFVLTIVGTILGLVSGLFYWILNHFIVPWLKGGQ